MLKTKLLVGIDEAGYGPSMGPLTIGATAWRVPSALDATDMTQLLEPEFLPKPLKSNSAHVPIGDSKKIHRDKLAVEGLLLGARFLCFAAEGRVPDDWDSQIASFALEDWKRMSGIAWYLPRRSSYGVRLDEVILSYSQYFDAALLKLRKHSIELAGIRMRVIDEIEFNRQVDRIGNKSTLLSESSLGLVKETIAAFSKTGEAIEVYCDKHGGRNRYQSILTFMFDQEWFEIESEGRDCSRYSSQWSGHPMRVQFTVDGDSIFPSAAASILAKWTREELMDRLNGFWQSKVKEGVASTAGYYVDAMRFAKQIEQTATKTGLSRDQRWRKK